MRVATNRQMPTVFVLVLQAFISISASAHFGDHDHEEEPTTNASTETGFSNSQGRGNPDDSVKRETAKVVEMDVDKLTQRDSNAPESASVFARFANVKTRWDATHLFIESNGMPNHKMMVGIRNWQQQVPLPQPYTGQNAWQIPLHPRLAAKPISARDNLFRGAIAIAVNGIPIFNALNNRGEDAFLIGELDKWGGHCGRGDDYHYHAAPLHLQEFAGEGAPIAFALDGFPIYGLTEPDGSPVRNLDELNGHFDGAGNYHYHASKGFPYVNGGIRGVVQVRGGQIEPQPRDAPVRPAQRPLRGAVITSFESKTNDTFRLTYTVNARPAKIEYTIDDGRFDFTYTDTSGSSRKESYTRATNDARRRSPSSRQEPTRRRGSRRPRR